MLGAHDLSALAQVGEIRECRVQLRQPNDKQPQSLATDPNRVWNWDITKLLRPLRYTYSSLYVTPDTFSRYLVGRVVADRESPNWPSASLTRPANPEPGTTVRPRSR